MSRVLLEADNAEIWRAEVQTAIGGVQVDRYVVKDQTAGSFNIATLPVKAGEVVRIRSVLMMKQVGGSAGTIGNSAMFELCSTFKHHSSALQRVGSLSILAAHKDDSYWGSDFTITNNVLSFTLYFDAPTGSTDLHVVCNLYSYLHTLKA